MTPLLVPRNEALLPGEFLHVDVLELEEGRGAVPFAVAAFAAVVLEAYGAGLFDAGELGVVDDFLAVEDDGDSVALAGDLEAVPLTDGVVGLVFGGDTGA